MTVMLLTLGIFAALMSGMAVGVIFGNKPLKGSCGGVGGSCACEEAGKPGACKLPDAGAAELMLGSTKPDFRPPGALMDLRKRSS